MSPFGFSQPAQAARTSSGQDCLSVSPTDQHCAQTDTGAETNTHSSSTKTGAARRTAALSGTEQTATRAVSDSAALTRQEDAVPLALHELLPVAHTQGDDPSTREFTCKEAKTIRDVCAFGPKDGNPASWSPEDCVPN